MRWLGHTRNGAVLYSKHPSLDGRGLRGGCVKQKAISLGDFMFFPDLKKYIS